MKKRIVKWPQLMVRLLLVLTLGMGSISIVTAGTAIAQSDSGAEQITSEMKRTFALELLKTRFPVTSQAASTALMGDDESLNEFFDSGAVVAQTQDLSEVLVTISSISGSKVQQRINEILAQNAGDQESLDRMINFFDTEYGELKAHDDRAIAWRAMTSPEGSAVRRAAEAALRENTSEALSNFADEGLRRAEVTDRRRQVYELTRSPLPSVAAGAAEALKINTDSAIDGYLRYGQFVNSAQDYELMTVEQLVSSAVKESERAVSANAKAESEANRAARAAENARIATERAKEEAIQARNSSLDATAAAQSAGELAQKAASAADEAVAANQEAQRALQQTAEALNQATQAAVRARLAASEAQIQARNASTNRNFAQQARDASFVARDAAKAAQDAEKAFDFAVQSRASATMSEQFAQKASENADAAAKAADIAASADGVGADAARSARAGAERARKAAQTARQSAQKVDGFVSRIGELVDQARKATADAVAAASRAADAADEAARSAGIANDAAEKSARFAKEAAESAQAAAEVLKLAEQVSEVARVVASDRRENESAFLSGQAIGARAAEDRQRRTYLQLRDKERQIEEFANLDSGQRSTDLQRVRQIAVFAVEVGAEPLSSLAEMALKDGSESRLRTFAMEDVPHAFLMKDLSIINAWAQHSDDPILRDEAINMRYRSADEVSAYVSSGANGRLTPELKKKAWEMRKTAGKKVQAEIDKALLAGTYEALNPLFNGDGLDKARWEDDISTAYHLAESGLPEVKIAAKAAVQGDRSGLRNFVAVDQYWRASLDYQSQLHEKRVSALLDRGRYAVLTAQESAANAQAAVERARGASEAANSYADAAARYARDAKNSADRAEEGLRSAQNSLTFAQQQQVRAHAAASEAERASKEADRNAAEATRLSTEIHALAVEAQENVNQARNDADAANAAKNEADKAAREAFSYAVAIGVDDKAELISAADQAGEMDGVPSSPGVVEVLVEELGPEVVDIVLEFFGIKALEDCVRGSAVACVDFGIGAIPYSKILKAPKLAKAVSKLSSKLGTILKKLNNRSVARLGRHGGDAKPSEALMRRYNERVQSALDKLLGPGSCFTSAAVSGTGHLGLTLHHAYGPSGNKKKIDFTFAKSSKPNRCPDEVELVNNRRPINSDKAGLYGQALPDEFREKAESALSHVVRKIEADGTAVYGKGTIDDLGFTPKGFIDFGDNVVKAPDGRPIVVKIPQYGTSPNVDYGKATELAAKNFGIDLTEKLRNELRLSWHHSHIKGQMELVPRSVHSKMRHTGGWAIYVKSKEKGSGGTESVLFYKRQLTGGVEMNQLPV